LFEGLSDLAERPVISTVHRDDQVTGSDQGRVLDEIQVEPGDVGAAGVELEGTEGGFRSDNPASTCA
jgi:hypothetical protein